MYSRSYSPARKRATARRIVRKIHWRAIHLPEDWFSAHRASQIEARIAETRDRAFIKQQELGRRCGY
jgi:hypothetical protein